MKGLEAQFYIAFFLTPFQCFSMPRFSVPFPPQVTCFGDVSKRKHWSYFCPRSPLHKSEENWHLLHFVWVLDGTHEVPFGVDIPLLSFQDMKTNLHHGW